jgi:hypothetical protein
MSEPDALTSNSVEGRRLDARVAVRAGVDPGLIVGNGEQNVGPFGVRTRDTRHEDRRRQKEQEAPACMWLWHRLTCCSIDFENQSLWINLAICHTDIRR